MSTESQFSEIPPSKTYQLLWSQSVKKVWYYSYSWQSKDTVDYGLIKAKESGKRLQAFMKQVSILSKLTVQIFLLQTYLTCTSCAISCLSLKAKDKKEVSKTRCLRNNHKTRTGSITHVAFEYNVWNFGSFSSTHCFTDPFLFLHHGTKT